MKKYVVYCHTNKITRQKYIGITCQSIQERWRKNGQGYSGQPKFFNAIKKYGWDNFIHEILYYDLTAEEASSIEQTLIKNLNTIKNGYNVDKGGLITNHSNQTKQKISKAMSGKKHSVETIKQITKTKQEQTGFKVICIETGEIFQSMGEASKIKKVDKTSISRCCNGKQITAGGYHWKLLENDSTNNIVDKRKKKVQCITTGVIYDSVADAAKDTNSDPSNIIKVCNGKYKTTNKLKWTWFYE